VKDSGGKIYAEGCIPATRHDLDCWMKNLLQPWSAAMEPTMFSGWIYDHLKPHAAVLKVAHPSMLRAIAAAKKKTDRVDANKICDCLRCDSLPECYMASTAICERRCTLRYRNLLVRQMVQMKNKIGVLLMEAGVNYNNRSCTRPAISANCGPAARTSTNLRSLLRQCREMVVRLGKMEAALTHSLQQDGLLMERVERLMSIPAVGPIKRSAMPSAGCGVYAVSGTKRQNRNRQAWEPIMRSFNSGRRSSCPMGMLRALVLSASTSLTAQSGSQPPQSTSTPPPATQSQSQSTPACSDAPPILKRGKQQDLPPCPDPPVAASAPVDSTRTRSLSSSEALIERAREAAFEFSEKLPNFICQEVMARYRQRGRDETPLDVVSAEIIYDHAKESYRNVKINDRPTDTGLQEISGSWSTGEFASILLSLFSPDTNARFRPGGASSISGYDAQVYDFQVPSGNSRWTVHVDSQTLVPAYVGSVWVDPSTARVLRIEMQARNIPPDFPMDTIESAVDYSYVSIGATSFLLPVHAESLGCPRGAGDCSHNIIDFRNYHEFRVDVKIGNVQRP